MTAPKRCPSQAELHQRFDYDHETGKLTYRTALGGVTVGAEAGSIKLGYRWVGFSSKVFPAHRLIWVYVHGSDPEEVIDHVNGDGTDNRLVNLRAVSQSINLLNIHPPMDGNTSGVRGVSFNKQCQKFQACIHYGRRSKYLGLFDRREDAQRAYLAAKRGLMPMKATDR